MEAEGVLTGRWNDGGGSPILVRIIGKRHFIRCLEAQWPRVTSHETTLDLKFSHTMPSRILLSTYGAKALGLQRNASAAMKTSWGY